MKKIIIVLLTTLFARASFSQSVHSIIDMYGEKAPLEKVHVHFDKDSYFPGETIWFKAYIAEEQLPTTRSTNFFIALYSAEGNLVQQFVGPIINGSCNGQFNLPDSISTSSIYCKAYTKWMLQFDTTFVFSKEIKLNQQTIKKTEAIANNLVSLSFFPEGGNAIENTTNNFGFKAVYSNGEPFNTQGKIFEYGSNRIVDSFTTEHNGMGKLSLFINPSIKYYAQWKDEQNKTVQTMLPNALPNGASLTVTINNNNKLHYKIYHALPNDTVHVLMYLYQKTFYRSDIVIANKQTYERDVELNGLPTGCAKITIFNSQWQPLCERVIFINNQNYRHRYQIEASNWNSNPKAKNELNIITNDTAITDLSVSITDADINYQIQAPSIFTNMLLASEIRGYIQKPEYYFSNDTSKQIQQHLDLVMLTSGWRRYNWDILRTGMLPINDTTPETFLTVYGKLSSQIVNSLSKDESILLVIKAKDSSTQFYNVVPQYDGTILLPGLVFFDSATASYSFNKQKKLNPMLGFSQSTLFQPVSKNINIIKPTLGVQQLGSISNTKTETIIKAYNNQYAKSIFNKSNTLSEVVVTANKRYAWRNSPLQKLEDDYTNGAFKGVGLAEQFDVMHDPQAQSATDLFNYLGYRSTYVKLSYKSGVKVLQTRQLFVCPAVGVFLNEMELDPELMESQLQSISMDRVAYIKIMPRYVLKTMACPSSTFSTVVAIYLKKGKDLIEKTLSKPSDLSTVKLAGYSPVKEFYMPDYTNNQLSTTADYRSTLVWKPNVQSDANNTIIHLPFYNNDITKKIRIVIDGIDEDGKLVHEEKIIE